MKCSILIFCTICLVCSSICLANELNRRPVNVERANIAFKAVELDSKINETPVHCIDFDKNGNLWIGTEGGLIVYDGGRVRHYYNTPSDESTLKANFVRDIVTDDTGIVWVGTWGGGLHRYSPQTDSFVRIGGSTANYDQQIWTLAVDSESNIWIGGFTKGLFKYEAGSENISKIGLKKNDDSYTDNIRVKKIFIVDNNRILVVTHKSGIYLIDAHSLNVIDKLESNEFNNTELYRDAIKVGNNFLVSHDKKISIIKITDNNLEIDQVLDIKSDSGSFMFAKQNGEILTFTEDEISLIESERLEVKQLLSSDHPYYPESEVFWDYTNDKHGRLLIAKIGRAHV